MRRSRSIELNRRELLRAGSFLAPLLLLAAASCSGFGAGGYSDVRIDNVTLEMPLTDAQPASIAFDVAWDNSFRDDLNWDAVWVFVKFREPGQPWRHADISTDASAHRIGENNGVLATLAPAADGRGIFLHRADDGQEYVYFAGGMPAVRVRANLASYLDPSQYETYTFLRPGTETDVHRNPDGSLKLEWRRSLPKLNLKQVKQ